MESDSENNDHSYNNESKKLKLILKEQRRKIRTLKDLVKCKDVIIKEFSEVLEVKDNELQRIEKSHRVLTDILNEERRHYILEKQKFCEEVLKSKRRLLDSQNLSDRSSTYKDVVSINDSLNVKQIKAYANNQLCLEVSALKKENEKLRSLIEESDEKNHELCQRFLRVQHKKQMIWEKLKEVDEDFLNSLKNVMTKFNDLREEYNVIVNDGFLTKRSNTKNKYLKMAKSNCNLAYENSCLKLELQSLKTDINKKIYSPRAWKYSVKTANVAVQYSTSDGNEVT